MPLPAAAYAASEITFDETPLPTHASLTSANLSRGLSRNSFAAAPGFEGCVFHDDGAIELPRGSKPIADGFLLPNGRTIKRLESGHYVAPNGALYACASGTNNVSTSNMTNDAVATSPAVHRQKSFFGRWRRQVSA